MLFDKLHVFNGLVLIRRLSYPIIPSPCAVPSLSIKPKQSTYAFFDFGRGEFSLFLSFLSFLSFFLSFLGESTHHRSRSAVPPSLSETSEGTETSDTLLVETSETSKSDTSEMLTSESSFAFLWDFLSLAISTREG